MPTLREKIAKIRHRAEFLGISCCGYIRLTPKYSLKLYSDKSDRDGAFVRQRIAHNLKFGPKTLFKVDKGKLFGYVTEHAETKKELTLKQLRFLKAKLRSQGWSTRDISTNVNVGLINDEPVLIDFDPCSLGIH